MMKKNKINIIIFLIGLSLILVTVGLHINHQKYIENALKVNANVVEIEKRLDSEDNVTYYFDIEYKIKDKTYKGKITSVDSKVEVGDEITIYCDKDNLEKFKEKDPDLLIYIPLVVGVATILISAIVFIKEANINKIKKQNKFIMADITSVTDEQIDDYAKFEVITCEAIINGKKRIFIGKVFENSNAAKEAYKNGNNKIKVYLDGKKEDKYFVDVFEYVNLYKNKKGN